MDPKRDLGAWTEKAMRDQITEELADAAREIEQLKSERRKAAQRATNVALLAFLGGCFFG